MPSPVIGQHSNTWGLTITNSPNFGLLANPTPPSPELKKPKHEGIRVGEIIAYRCWLLRSDGYLRSAVMESMWAPGEAMQMEEGSLGIHAWKTRAKCLKYGMAGYVIGSVALWGEVTECKHGYTAEFAAIRTIDDFLSSRKNKIEVIKALRQRYDVGGDDSFKAFIDRSAFEEKAEKHEKRVRITTAQAVRAYNASLDT